MHVLLGITSSVCEVVFNPFIQFVFKRIFDQIIALSEAALSSSPSNVLDQKGFNCI